MGMCAAAGKKRGYADGGEIDAEMQKRIAENQAKYNPKPKQGLFSGLFGNPKPQAATPAQPAQPSPQGGMAGTIQKIENRKKQLDEVANYSGGGMIGATMDRITNRHMQNNAAMREEGSINPVNYDAERERQSDEALARKMASIQPKANTAKPNGLMQMLGYGSGGMIRGPGTPTSDSIPAKVKQTGEEIAVSTEERILSKKQDLAIQGIAHGMGFKSTDEMLESLTGEPVGPTMKGGKAAAEFGKPPEDIIRSGNSFSQSASAATAPMTDVNSYGNSMTQTNAMQNSTTAFAPREAGMAGTNIYDSGAGTSTGLSGAVDFTANNASTITPPIGAQQSQQQAQQQAIAQPLSTGSSDLDTLGTAEGSAPKFANKSMSDIAKEQGIGNMAYRAGGAGDPNASNPMARQSAPMGRQRRQPQNLMPTVDDMFQKRGFAGGGRPEEGWAAGGDKRLTLDDIHGLIGTKTAQPGFMGAEGQPHPSLAVRGSVPVNAQPLAAQAVTQPKNIPQATYSNEGRSVRADQVLNKEYQDGAETQRIANTPGFVGQRVTDSGAVMGRSNVDATRLQAPDGGGYITRSNGQAVFLPPSSPTVRDPNGQYDANGNNMARTNQMKQQIAEMQRDRMVRDMGADITSPGTRYAAQQQLAALDKGQGMAMLADRAQRDDVTAGLDQQGKRQAIDRGAMESELIGAWRSADTPEQKQEIAGQLNMLRGATEKPVEYDNKVVEDWQDGVKVGERVVQSPKNRAAQQNQAPAQQSFKTADEVEAAKKAGKLKPGEVVLINGRQARIN